ncbi:MAG: queuosine precursor transporter [Phycisphaerales bacterium]
MTNSTEPVPMTRGQQLYLWLSAISVTCLLIGDVVGIKLFRIPLGFSVSGIDSIVHTCGMLAFPVTFLITDVANEFFGKRAARRIALLSFSMAILAFLFINVSLAMPSLDADFNIKPETFKAVFGNARIMYVASLTAYLVGTFCDISIFALLKRVTRGKMIWLRSTGSTVISQMIDSLVVTYLAFSLGRTLFPAPDSVPMPLSEVFKTAATGYSLKLVIALCLTPVIYLCHGFIKRVFHLTPVPADQQ